MLSFTEKCALLKRNTHIKHLIITHFHPDHAGLVQNIKDNGAQLVLHSNQASYVGPLKQYFKPQHMFKEIDGSNNIVVTSTNSRVLLKTIGIEGEIIPTPGHSDDSISLVVDRCCAFTGDLPNLSLASWDNNSVLKNSWDLIRKHEVITIYPGHGNPFSL